jgi:AcrR family transcriptional regulator
VTAAADRPLRADARRNRAKVLAAARTAFAADGLAVPLDEIARRAGVGAGTVYRHFPTKEALFEAIVLDQIIELTERAVAATRSPDVGAAFYRYITDLVSDGHTKKDLADALATTGLRDETLRRSAELQQAVSDLLTAAQRAGAVRPDIDADDLHALTLGAITASHRHTDPARTRRVIAVLCDGLRAQPTAEV